MSALSWGQGRRNDVAPAATRRRADFADRFVLPRLLRRPARFFSRLSDGEVAPPRFGATIACALLFGATAAYGVALGGYGPSIVAAVTARSGFAIEEVKISGHRETSEIDILERLGLDGWTSLVGLNVDSARVAISGLPWVETAEVRKIYPGTVEIALVERKPYALWQTGEALTIIEADGRVIAPFSGKGRYAGLPLLVGAGAPEQAKAVVEKFALYPDLMARVKAYVLVGQRRWDLKLDNGITVKLPENGEDQAIAALLDLDRSHNLLARDIDSVDLRVGNRLVVGLTPAAALRREAELLQREKDAKKAARSKRT